MSENILASQASVILNVRVVVGKPDADGRIQVRTDRRFKNTATRLMTESICNYLTGAENTYKRGKGRPNYMGIGTMGILKQPWNTNDKAEVEDGFENKNFVDGVTTRPWFESTSLALTDVCGPKNPDERGISQHYWDAEKGWGKNGFTGDVSDEPIFQGELCTSRIPNHDVRPSEQDGWDLIGRIPILRADVLSDCPADWDYGVDGYCSQAIFYGYASIEWVHNLLNPTKRVWVPDIDPEKAAQGKGTWRVEPVGPQLDVMAVSEFGLYEKNNTDPHGLDTMLAGFRVPTADDIVYVTDGEVILIEWRVSVRAIMPNERIGGLDDIPMGILLRGKVIDLHHIQYTATTGVGERAPGVFWWRVEGNKSASTNISSTGLLTIGNDETTSRLVIYATSGDNPNIQTSTIVNISSVDEQNRTMSMREPVTYDGAGLTVHLESESPEV